MEPARTRFDFAASIRASWQASIDGIFEAGRLIAQAKADLPHGEFIAMVESDLPFGRHTAYRLMEVASDPRLVAQAHQLPANWTTLFELSRLPDSEFQRLAHPEVDRADIRAARKQIVRQDRIETLLDRAEALPERRYSIILADPEWSFENWSEAGMVRSAANHYPVSPTDTIAARDVASIAADDALLLLWATAPMLPDALRVMASWSFTYKSHFVWTKDRDGTGYWIRNRHELLLLGTRGSFPAPLPSDLISSVIEAPRGAHSAKPEAILDWIDDVYSELPRIELNRRGGKRPGWDAWGNEAKENTNADRE
jgi:N6-adenosine-specific RNA methylase IME4